MNRPTAGHYLQLIVKMNSTYNIKNTTNIFVAFVSQRATSSRWRTNVVIFRRWNLCSDVTIKLLLSALTLPKQKIRCLSPSVLFQDWLNAVLNLLWILQRRRPFEVRERRLRRRTKTVVGWRPNVESSLNIILVSVGRSTHYTIPGL